jgi:hypothetical protein
MITTTHTPETKEWHTVKQGANAGGSHTYLGEKNTDTYEFVTCVSYTKDKRVVICHTEKYTYVVSQREDGRWITATCLEAR